MPKEKTAKQIATESIGRVVIEVEAESRKKIKVLASMEGQTMQQWIAWMVNRAYDATVHNKGRKVPAK